MFSRWPIRNKLLIGLGLLLVLMATLSGSGFLGMYSYRGLVRTLSGRAAELPLASELAQLVGNLRVSLGESKRLRDVGGGQPPLTDAKALGEQFHNQLSQVRDRLDGYVELINGNDREDNQIGDHHHEQLTAAKIEDALARIETLQHGNDWVLDRALAEDINVQLETLQDLATELPSHLHERIRNLAHECRAEYRGLIILTWVITLGGLALLTLLVHLFYRWIFRPLRVLVKGSRRIAAGEFNHRIVLDTRDEMSELADALNAMTARFNAIRADLDHQVQERTKQVVRSEQLAGVGFLAAGVAHEINNPLASIAMCAESLEGRLSDLLCATAADEDQAADSKVVSHYLRMIQDEAFRCKEITEKLLDFSRMGEVKRQHVDLRELVQGVIDMVGHLGKYSQKKLDFHADQPVIVAVNPQEIKQVVLNLITNGLDSVEADGTLSVEIVPGLDAVELYFTDDGCGMNEEVLKHLFEPFFTRKRGGQGTGLGLSIVYRIVADHEGQIDARSAGPGQGSQFRVSLPLRPAPVSSQDKPKETSHRYQAA